MNWIKELVRQVRQSVGSVMGVICRSSHAYARRHTEHCDVHQVLSGVLVTVLVLMVFGVGPSGHHAASRGNPLPQVSCIQPLTIERPQLSSS